MRSAHLPQRQHAACSSSRRAVHGLPSGCLPREHPLPVVTPSEVLPPPPQGSQYSARSAWQDRNAYASGGGGGAGGPGGGRGGVFTSFGDGSFFSPRRGGLLERLRLMVLSVLWAISVYLVLSAVFRALGWLDRTLGVTAALGYGPGARVGLAHSASRGARHGGAAARRGRDDEDELTVASEGGEVEVVAAAAAGAGGPAFTSPLHGGPEAAAAAAAAATGDGRELLRSLSSVPAMQQAAFVAAGAAGAGVVPTGRADPMQGPGLGLAGGVAEGQVAGMGMASPLDADQQAHLELLKRYEARRGLSAAERHASHWSGYGGHATAAYFMVLGTMMGFFFLLR